MFKRYTQKKCALESFFGSCGDRMCRAVVTVAAELGSNRALEFRPRELTLNSTKDVRSMLGAIAYISTVMIIKTVSIEHLTTAFST